MPVSDRMELSARFRYLGGRPYTQRTYDSTYARWYIPDNTGLNTLRYPSLFYHGPEVGTQVWFWISSDDLLY